MKTSNGAIGVAATRKSSEPNQYHIPGMAEIIAIIKDFKIQRKTIALDWKC